SRRASGGPTARAPRTRCRTRRALRWPATSPTSRPNPPSPHRPRRARQQPRPQTYKADRGPDPPTCDHGTVVALINVLGTELQPCSFDPRTGYYRSGWCENRGDDPGVHVICCRVTDDFLEFQREIGNDLSTPLP